MTGEHSPRTPQDFAAWAISPEGKELAQVGARDRREITRLERLVRHYEGVLRLISIMTPVRSSKKKEVMA